MIEGIEGVGRVGGAFWDVNLVSRWVMSDQREWKDEEKCGDIICGS